MSVTTSDVFGVARDLPRNYVTRPAVDDRLVSSLTRDKHVVIYGSSKQGKTCLRKYHLKPEEYEVVTCSNKWKLSQIHTAILKQAGYVIEQSRTRTETGAAKITARASGGFKLFGVKGEAGLEGSGEKGHSDQVVTGDLELDPADVNEVISALRTIGFNKWLILEDFHYLPEETQRDFAIALKAFHESSEYVFIIVGVWLQENRLIQFNGDLSGRVTTVNADQWSREELQEAVDKGADLLNIRFEQKFLDGLLDGSYDSIHVVQETCLAACEAANVFKTQADQAEVSGDPQKMIRSVVDTQSGRYGEFLANFATGFGETELEMYRWILAPVVLATPRQLENGLPYRWLRKQLEKHHPVQKLNAGNVTQALKSVSSLQVQQQIIPIVLDYDSGLKKLNVVDRSFLIWLRHQDKQELLDAITLPQDLVHNWDPSAFGGGEDDDDDD
jgi:hypothetical protein